MLFFATLIVTLICAVLALHVEINTDMSRYLPASSPMRRGKEILEQAFPNDPEQSSFRFAFRGLDESEIPEVQKRLEDHVYVSRVEHVSGDRRYERDGRTLFVVFVDAAYDSHEAENVRTVLADRFSDYDLEGLLKEFDWLHLSGITPALSPSCADLILRMLETAKDLGLTVSFDGNFRSNLWSWEEARDFCTKCWNTSSCCS